MSRSVSRYLGQFSTHRLKSSIANPQQAFQLITPSPNTLTIKTLKAMFGRITHSPVRLASLHFSHPATKVRPIGECLWLTLVLIPYICCARQALPPVPSYALVVHVHLSFCASLLRNKVSSRAIDSQRHANTVGEKRARDVTLVSRDEEHRGLGRAGIGPKIVGREGKGKKVIKLCWMAVAESCWISSPVC